MINLLPWREEHINKVCRLWLLAMIVFSMMLSGVSLYIKHITLIKINDTQNANHFLQTKLRKLPAKLKLQQQRKQGRSLEKNIHLIEKIYGHNQQALTLLLAIAKHTTANIAIQSIEINAGCLRLQGVGENTAAISTLLASLAQSNAFNNAQLIKLKHIQNTTQFLITANTGGHQCS